MNNSSTDSDSFSLNGESTTSSYDSDEMNEVDKMIKKNKRVPYYQYNKHLKIAYKHSKNIQLIKDVNLDIYFKEKEEENKRRARMASLICSFGCDCHKQCSLLHGNISGSIPEDEKICKKHFSEFCFKGDCKFNHIISNSINRDDEEY